MTVGVTSSHAGLDFGTATESDHLTTTNAAKLIGVNNNRFLRLAKKENIFPCDKEGNEWVSGRMYWYRTDVYTIQSAHHRSGTVVVGADKDYLSQLTQDNAELINENEKLRSELRLTDKYYRMFVKDTNEFLNEYYATNILQFRKRAELLRDFDAHTSAVNASYASIAPTSI